MTTPIPANREIAALVRHVRRGALTDGQALLCSEVLDHLGSALRVTHGMADCPTIQGALGIVRERYDELLEAVSPR